MDFSNNKSDAIYKNLKFIDLSADFRLKDPNIYFKTYKNHHKAKNLIRYAIYSISELSRKELLKQLKKYQEKKSLFSQIELMLQFPHLDYILKSR